MSLISCIEQAILENLNPINYHVQVTWHRKQPLMEAQMALRTELFFAWYSYSPIKKKLK